MSTCDINALRPKAIGSVSAACRPTVLPYPSVIQTLDWAPVGLADAALLRDPGEAQLWLMALDNPPWPLEELAADLDAAEAERAARFHFQRDAHRYQAAHGMLRRVLARHLGMAPREIRFTTGDAGKPSLLGPGAADLTFNLSHSGCHALLGVTRAGRIGVYIEVVRELADRDAIAASHFASAEQRELQALPPELRTDGFFAGWTRKEAYVKALGGGLSIALADFEVSLDPRALPALRAGLAGASEAARWALWSAQTQPGVWAAAAIEHNPVQLHGFSLQST